MDILTEHNYAKLSQECNVQHGYDDDLLEHFKLEFDQVENDVWFDSLDSLGNTMDVSELLNLSPSDTDSAADFFSMADDCSMSDAGYDSMSGSHSPESTSSGGDSDSGTSGTESSLSPQQQNWLPLHLDLDALLGDLQDAVKASAEVYTKPAKYDSTRLQPSSPSESIPLCQSPVPGANTSNVTQTHDGQTAPPTEKRKKLAQNHSDRISGPTAFLGNAVCWESGLTLTEEEKETLLTDGCPIPTSLPLSVEEEKALKLARRKIKNKISAQESRRKKKEFIDSMQQRVDSSARENRLLQKRVEDLENKNCSLLEELQALKRDIARQQLSRTPATAHATLLVLAVCFAFALPAIFGTGMSGLWLPGASQETVAGGKVASFDYSVTNFRSRTLMQLKDPEEIHDDNYHDDINGSGGWAPSENTAKLAVDLLASSSPGAFFSLEEDSGQVFPNVVAIVSKENTTVPVPA